MLAGHSFSFFFFNDTATTEIYTLSLHDALPILPLNSTSASVKSLWSAVTWVMCICDEQSITRPRLFYAAPWASPRSEEHTSELQSQSNLVCRLLLEIKKALALVSGCVLITSL